MDDGARQRIAKYYDEWAPSYEADWRRTDLMESFVAGWLARNVVPGHRVLDVGCGPGQFTRRLPADVQVCGTDISPVMLERARAGRPSGDFRLHSYYEPLPADLGRFDRILAIGCFEFCSDLALVLAHLGAALRPEGRMLVNIAERRPDEEPVTWIESLGAGQYRYGRDAVEAAVRRAGLAVRAAERHGVYINYKTGDVPPYLFWELAPSSPGRGASS